MILLDAWPGIGDIRGRKESPSKKLRGYRRNAFVDSAQDWDWQGERMLGARRLDALDGRPLDSERGSCCGDISVAQRLWLRSHRHLSRVLFLPRRLRGAAG